MHEKAWVRLYETQQRCIPHNLEARALGIKMGQPVFEIRDLIEQHDVALFSSNYPLYADMSARVMSTLSAFSPRAEVYSIDDALSKFKMDYGGSSQVGQ